MEQLFQQYEQLYAEFEDLNLEDFPRALRTFNIRFRLALDLMVDYKGEVAYVKTPAVKETYIAILKLVELWNAYEALIRYVKSDLGYNLHKVAPDRDKKPEFRKGVEEFFEKTGALSTLLQLLLTLKEKTTTKASFQRDLTIYFDRIDASKNIENKIKYQVKDIDAFIHNAVAISGVEGLALIYLERNLYYHNGEPGKMGIAYSNRKEFLELYRVCLTEIILKTICYVLKEQIRKHQ